MTINDDAVTKEFLTVNQITNLNKLSVKIARRRFRLSVFTRQDDEFNSPPIWSCPIAIGAIGFETPAKPYNVLGKESPPTYTAPDRKWAREAGFKPGEKLPADHPANPLRGAFLWLTKSGIGIHGTDNLLSLRSKASHGCIRVRPKDAIYLYNIIALGTPVLIV